MYSYEYIKSIINNTESKLLSKEYFGYKQELKLQCSCGEIYYRNITFVISKINKGKQVVCEKCALKNRRSHNRLDYKHVKDTINSTNGCLLLSNCYKNSRSKLEIRCVCGNIFKTTYNNFIHKNKTCCDYCSEVNQKKIEDLKKEFEYAGYILVSEEYVNASEKLRYICKKHKDKGILEIAYNHFYRGKGCKYCGIEKRSGENNHFWKGGITPIQIYLRENISDWKKETMKSCEYKCVITGNKFTDIHHKHSFSSIVEEVFDITGLKVHSETSFYKKEELELLVKTCKDVHFNYGLGACLSDEIHKLYHSIYGKRNNTIDQWNQFEQDFKAGKYIEGIDY